MRSFLVFFFFSALMTNALGAPPSRHVLEREIAAARGAGFEALLKKWQAQYGTSAVNPLLSVAKDPKAPDTSRYIALMASTRMGGEEALRQLEPTLKDRSWMLRAGFLRASLVSTRAEWGEKAVQLLRDPALVVRTEALETVMRFKPKHYLTSVYQMLEDRTNFQPSGKALFVAQRAAASLQRALSITPAQEKREVAALWKPRLSRVPDPRVRADLARIL